MLLIAQPKSASTSLLMTLSKMMNLKGIKGLKKESWHIEYSDYPILQTYHSLIFEKSAFEIRLMVNTKKRIYREHLIPENTA